VRRGELWWVDLGSPVGSAPGYERPSVIVSADRFNKSQLNTVIVVPLYSNLDYARHAGNVLLTTLVTGLDRDSVANVTQLGSVDRQQLLRQVGAVPPSLMAQLDDGLRLVLGV
jgi:mRNA interferase MazF